MMSPAWMYSRARSTAASNSSRVKLLQIGPISGSLLARTGGRRHQHRPADPLSSASVATARQ